MPRTEEATGLPEGVCASGDEASDIGRGIGRQARKRIGTHLRALYETTLKQPVPDRFADLIARLDDAAFDDGAEEPL